MRILVLSWKDIAHPTAGGAEVYLQEVAKRWAADGHQVTIFSSRAAGLAARDRIDGITIRRAGGRYSVYREARRYYAREAMGRFDVVLDVVNTRPFLAPEFVRDVPVVALVHQVAREVWFKETALPLALVGRFVLEPRWLHTYRSNPVITVSESSARSLARYGIQDAVVVHNGLDMPDLPRSLAKETSPTLVFVGRLSASKRPRDVLTAFSRVRSSLPDARLWVVGTGPLERRLRRHHPPGVTFFGRVDEIEKFTLLSRAHALVVTSVREGWGRVVSEAACVGTMTVGYDVPGLQDSVPASGGLLVDASPRKLAAALQDLLRQASATGPLPSCVSRPPGWDQVAREILTHLQAATPRRGTVLDLTAEERSAGSARDDRRLTPLP